MICKVLFAVLTVSFISKARANCNADYENKGKVTNSIDVAIQLLKNVKDNYPNCTSKWLPMDCEDILLSGENISGVYEVWPRSRVVKGSIKVYCDMETDGGGWTVVQRRGNYMRPKDFFYQDWDPYKEGFGDIDKDFWLGNDNIFGLSNQRSYSIRFDLKDVENNSRYATYDRFWIDDETNQYTLHIGGYSGDAGDSMIEWHNGQKFSTRNRDNDKEPTVDCAAKYKGGWWYNVCHAANLNGLYHRGKHESFADGVNWSSWKGNNESLESTEIKIRRKDFQYHREKTLQHM